MPAKTLAHTKVLLLVLFVFFCGLSVSAQMRSIYQNTDASKNDLCRFSFYSPSQGFVAFSQWIGFTTDSGRTFTKKTITLKNVDYNGYSVNLTFGFGISGIKAFDQNNLLVYGDYGTVPAILSSVDGGNTFKLVFHSQQNPLQLSLTNSVKSMSFIPNSPAAFAVDEDRVIATTNQGQSWAIIKTSLGSYYNFVQAIDANTIYTASTDANHLEKTTDGGASWQPCVLPTPTNQSRLAVIYFLNALTGWVSLVDNGTSYLYTTTNGGASWVLLNNPGANPFPGVKMQFINANTGYSVDGQNTVYKSLNGGLNWEPLPRDNNITYQFFSGNNDIQCMGNNQLWAGWAGLKMIELSINGGGTPLPRSYFFIDTAGVGATGTVNLTNYSVKGYSYQWFLNGKQLSTAYNAMYNHTADKLRDTVTLIVTNGALKDTAEHYVNFPAPLPPPVIKSFSPNQGGPGTAVYIVGSDLIVNGVLPYVTIGGVPATEVIGYSFAITVTVGQGASGDIKLTTAGGTATAGPFTFIPAPKITSFTPTAATLGDTVVIRGTNFTGVTAVTFGDSSTAAFTVVSDSVIKAKLWLGASGNISLTGLYGIASAKGFTYIAPPAPRIKNVSVLTATAGTPVKITGTHFYGITSVLFGGVPANTFNVVNDNEINAVVGLGATGYVRVKNIFGADSVAGFKITAPPVISTLSPQSGPVATPVTIKGANFSTVAAQNTVYFGSVKAAVTSATATQLTVKVPYGATYKPVSVTVNRLTGYSASPFQVTSDSARLLTDSSFNQKKFYPSFSGPIGSIATADFDGDGKPDIVNNFGEGPSITVLKNKCSPGVIAFDTMRLESGTLPTVAIADIDGDGKQDIVSTDQYSGYLYVFKNTSKGPGDFSFKPLVMPAGVSSSIISADFNMDGKPDLLSVQNFYKAIYLHANLSVNDSIAFAQPVDIGSPDEILAASMLASDIDGDGKPDIVVAAYLNGVKILRNKSTNGSMAFDSAKYYIPGGYFQPEVFNVSSADVDGDGKPDLVIGTGRAMFTIARNISTPGNIAFDEPLVFQSPDTYTSGIATGDMDGDGKLDVLLPNHVYGAIDVLKNASTPGKIVLNNKIRYFTNSSTLSITTCDVDMDGKPDIINNNDDGGYSLAVLRNSSVVNVIGSIRDTNYKVQVINNTCINKKEGKIIITIAQPLNYKLKITGVGLVINTTITGTTYEKDSLPAGTYQLCFTADALPGYQQCFTVKITEPKDLSLYSFMQAGSNTVSLTLGGSNVYNVAFNGSSFQTASSNISLQLQPGINTVSVQTPLPCQGVINKTFYNPAGTSGIMLAPNPTPAQTTLYLPGADNHVSVEIITIDGKTVVRPTIYSIGEDRAVHLNAGNLANGLYVVRVQGTTIHSTIKLIKTN